MHALRPYAIHHGSEASQPNWSIPATPLYFDQIFLHNSANHPQGVAQWPKT
jgi:hypothetical protein